MKVQSVSILILSMSAVLYFAMLMNRDIIRDTQPAPMWGNNCDYVGFPRSKKGHRLGNYMFFFSAVMHVAWLTGRRPCIWTTTPHTLIDTVFHVDIPHIDARTVGCTLHTFKQKGKGVYDPRVLKLTDVSRHKSLVIEGVFQSWKYAEPVAEKIRQKLTFRTELVTFVASFLATNVPRDWTHNTFVRVGVHVRRGDFLSIMASSSGFSTANERYFQRAMNYFAQRFQRIQFIVASDGIPWCKRHLTSSMFNDTTNVNITFSVGHSSGQDLALLASCNHTIMSTGTFSWWAAWLANGTTVYYANYPARGTVLSVNYTHTDYYHPQWIGIDD